MLKVLKTYRVFERNSTEHARRRVRGPASTTTSRTSPAGRCTVSMGYNGPAMPPRELDSGPDQQRDGRLPRRPRRIDVENHYVEAFYDEDTTRELSVNEDKLPAYWVGGSSVYFKAIVMPPTAGHQRHDDAVTSPASEAIGLDPDEADRQPRRAASFETAAMTRRRRRRRLDYPINVYFGPKRRRCSNKPYYAALPARLRPDAGRREPGRARSARSTG